MTLTPEQKRDVPLLLTKGKTMDDIATMYKCEKDDVWEAFADQINLHSLDKDNSKDMDDEEFYVKLLTQLN
tara:strand:+ start:5113 stop:5325 length:213 start_codon:yes stop_codon:yes gene_type:complete